MSSTVKRGLEAGRQKSGFEVSSVRPNANILLVDDQPARLLTYEAMLNGLGLHCVRALSGREALERLLQQEFAVIVLDVSMPEMDGFELAGIIREHPRLERTPIIFVTGVNISELDRLKGYAVGAIDYISVPVVPEILRSKVALLVELHQRRSELQVLNKALQEARAQLEADHKSAIAEKEALLHAVFEHPNQTTVVLRAVRDASGAIKDWIYQDANLNVLTLLRTTRDALIGQRVSEIIVDRADRVIAMCTQVSQSQQPIRYETRYGEVDFLNTIFFAGHDTVISSGTDITERKQADHALRSSQETLLIAKKAAKLGIHDWNVIDGTIEWDEYVYELWGVEPGMPVTYEMFASSVHPQDFAHMQAAVDRALDPNGEGTYLSTYRVINRIDGVVRWVQATGQVFFENARAVRMVGTVLDITEQHHLQESLKLADRRKDEFLAMLAHELRNPVAPIRNAAEVLSRLIKEERPRSLIAMIQRQGAHLSRILDDLLDVARITQGRIELQREPLSLSVAIDMAIETVQPQIQAKGHQLTITRTASPVLVHADRVRIEQCITNLLSNATKYTDRDGEICTRLYVEGCEAVIEVSDNGIGIPAEFMPRVFELFTQSERSLDRSQGGLGIGLSVCRQLIEMHGGTINCCSAGQGRGSMFTIRLPLLQSIEATPPATLCSQSPGRVLIVDDNRDAADSLAMYLAIEGHETRVVYSAEDALHAAKQFQPHAVLLDIGLPGMDGYEVARRLRAADTETRLIALTGYGQKEDKQRTSAAGFDAHLTKPVELATLVETLAAVRSR